MTHTRPPPGHTPVACPFCGLGCDDLRITIDTDHRPHLNTPDCPRAKTMLATASPTAPALIKGKPVPLTTAVEEAAARIARARTPLFAGLATDSEGVKALLTLAEYTGGIADHAYTTGYFHNAHTIQTEGWITTTIGEVRNRADLIIMAGTDGVSATPRFFDTCVWPKKSLFAPKPHERRIVYIGRGLNTKPGISPTGRRPLHLKSPPEGLTDIISALHALHKGRPLRTQTIASISKTQLEKLANMIKKARYGVIVWSASDLPPRHGHHTVTSISRFIKTLNLTQRFAGLPISGSNNILGATQVASWQSGYPLRISFATGTPQHDPTAYATQTLLDRDETDCLIWVSAFDPNLTPPRRNKQVPLILMGRPGTTQAQKDARKADVYLPVGIPGIDHQGSIVRADSVAALPLRQLRQTDLNATATLAHMILNALRTRGRPPC